MPRGVNKWENRRAHFGQAVLDAAVAWYDADSDEDEERVIMALFDAATEYGAVIRADDAPAVIPPPKLSW